MSHVTLHVGKACVEISKKGAHVLAWKDATGTEKLYLSPKAQVSEENIAIRGGIPIVFPQFGDGTLQKHGFARNLPWELVESFSGKLR
jgi:glucose-6-phosphate 1-epimerase